MSIPNHRLPKERTIFNINGVRAYLLNIPYTYTSSTPTWFVNGSNGDEFGQFCSEHDALCKAIAMSKLTEQARRHHDQ